MLPKLIAFDLDGTIWSPDMYMLWGGGSPFKSVSNSELRDTSKQPVKLLGACGELLDEFKTSPEWEGTKIAWVSCTDEPSWADECSRLFKTPMNVPLKDRVDEEMIFKANKQAHFKQLQSRLNIPYESMLFFDNEVSNIHSVSKLGVMAVHCPHGVTRELWDETIQSFKDRSVA